MKEEKKYICKECKNKVPCQFVVNVKVTKESPKDCPFEDKLKADWKEIYD